MTIEHTLQIALQHHQYGELDQAESLYRQLIEQPLYPVEVLHLLAQLIYQRGKASDLAAAYNLLGYEFFAQRKLEIASSYYQYALRLQPQNAKVHNDLAIVLYAQNQLNAAIVHYQQALALQPDYVIAWSNLGTLLNSQNQLEAALDCHRTVLRLQPNDAEEHFNYAMLLLKLGRFAEGWPEYEWRMGTAVIFEPPQPKWDGTPLAGRRLLVHWEQGFGDTIQFIRYLPFIKGGTVIFACRPPLATVCQELKGIDELVIVEEPAKEVPQIRFDVWITLSSLPYIFATTLDTIPSAVPYLFPELQKVAHWRPRFNCQRLNIGIVWAGSPGHQDDRNRSCLLTHFAPLANLPNLTLFSLQKGEAAAQLVTATLPIISLADDLKDFSDTAAVIACLDLVIAVDTAVAHLAGALGKPVWVLLPFASEWRWLTDRDDSPWYPTMRLFRQPRSGDWESVFAQVVQELSLKREMLQALRWSKPDSLPSSPRELAQTYTDAGNLLRAQNQLAVAKECYQRALRIQPLVETYNNLGGLCFAQNQLEEAKECCQQALRLQPESVDAYYNLGIILQQQNQLEAAVEAYQQAVRIRPDYVEAHLRIVSILEDQLQQEATSIDSQSKLSPIPKLAAAYYNLGIVFQQQKQLETAIEYYQKALYIQPHLAEAYHNLGSIFLEQKQLDAALTCYQQVLSVNPNLDNAYDGLGCVLYAQNQVEAALENYYQALRLQPDNADVYLNLAAVFFDRNQLAVALEYCQRALHLQPKLARAHSVYAEVLLTMAHFREGWEEHEWRRLDFQALQPQWEGTPLAGQRLLVLWEQGFGDTIQFVRYLPLITGGTVILACRHALATLFQGVAGVDELVIAEPSCSVAEVVFDSWIHLMSLPRIFATTLDNIPATVPYLWPDSSKISYWRDCLDPNQFKVGIVWAGNPKHANDHRRSCSLSHFAPLAQVSNVTFFSLQKGEAASQPVPVGLELISLTDELEDFSDTAAVITCLDLIIVVDTVVAHLAGALGKPVWVLLPFASDWRWLRDREDSPWYPTMRLFRQPSPGDWESVLAQVVKELSVAREIVG